MSCESVCTSRRGTFDHESITDKIVLNETRGRTSSMGILTRFCPGKEEFSA